MQLLPLALALLAGCSAGCAADAPAQSAVTAPPTQESGAREPFDHTHARGDALLKTHVRGPLFDYAAVAKAPAELEAYLAELAAVTPAELAGWSEAQRFAFWVNVYNAYTVKLIVDNLPLESIQDLDGMFGLASVFDRSWIPLEALHPSGKAKPLSLNDVEHGILRKRFEDARLHAAVNCASWSCPPLRAEAFVATKLDAQLEEQMQAFVADRERNPFDRDAGVARISKIFEWFEEDFVRDAGSVRAYLLRFSGEEDSAFLRDAKIRHAEYDWKLNALPPEYD